MESNPCMTCGACCAFFRVSFYWAEADPATGGITPPEVTEPVSPTLVAMRGTHCAQPHCSMLEGQVGNQVQCRIYDQRPSTCRAFEASWLHGKHHADCDRARAHYGLPPLEQPLTDRIDNAIVTQLQNWIPRVWLITYPIPPAGNYCKN